ncbi:MAG: WbuC family cupin fold metalloprotein [Fimbriimonadaceae bacterium]|nr:WbuC family cupin fold metalloprotein [Fimbriimonadaceae bacterium]
MSVFRRPDCSQVLLAPADLGELWAAARAAPKRRARICLHRDHADPVQEMLVAICADAWLPPLRLPGREKSFHVLAGQLSVVLFEAQRPVRTIRLGALDSGLPFGYRLAGETWHMTVPHVETLYLEVIAGPFPAAGTPFAPWAPGPDDAAAGLAWRAALLGESLP